MPQEPKTYSVSNAFGQIIIFPLSADADQLERFTNICK